MSSTLEALRAKRAQLAAAKQALAAGGAASGSTPSSSAASASPVASTPPLSVVAASPSLASNSYPAVRDATTLDDGKRGADSTTGSDELLKRPRLEAASAAAAPASAASAAPSAPAFAPSSTPAPTLDAASILSYQSLRSRGAGAAVESLLSAPTLAERLRARPFRQELVDEQGRPIGLKLLCAHKTLARCEAERRGAAASRSGPRTAPPPPQPPACDSIHLVERLTKLTLPELGDCNFLESCSNPACRRVHYEIYEPDREKLARARVQAVAADAVAASQSSALLPPAASSVLAVPSSSAASASSSSSSGLVSASTPHAEWLCCDIRCLDVGVLGRFNVIMMDPPWRINMNLPYETMSDEEMLALNIAPLQTDGVCIVWVVTRALDLGRRCLARWGYTEAGELLWVKIDQLYRLRRTGRTGHWLNHTKEHALIGVKGLLPPNRHLDCDVIVSPVRETSRKPDEVYGLLERLWPGARRLEIFGRQHNTRPGWLTLGNQLAGCRVSDLELKRRIEMRYGAGAAEKEWIGPPAPGAASTSEAAANVGR